MKYVEHTFFLGYKKSHADYVLREPSSGGVWQKI